MGDQELILLVVFTLMNNLLKFTHMALVAALEVGEIVLHQHSSGGVMQSDHASVHRMPVKRSINEEAANVDHAMLKIIRSEERNIGGDCEGKIVRQPSCGAQSITFTNRKDIAAHEIFKQG